MKPNKHSHISPDFHDELTELTKQLFEDMGRGNELKIRALLIQLQATRMLHLRERDSFDLKTEKVKARHDRELKPRMVDEEAMVKRQEKELSTIDVQIQMLMM